MKKYIKIRHKYWGKGFRNKKAQKRYKRLAKKY